MQIEIVVKNIPDLEDKLSLPKVEKALTDLSGEVAYRLLKYWSLYPPETISNSPSNPRGYWYERGYGWKGRINKSVSEQLDKKWAVNNRFLETDILNFASYAPFVHSEEKITSQHKKTGWRTDRQSIDYMGGSKEIEKAAEEIFNDWWE